MARGAVLRAFNEPLAMEEAPVPDPEPGALIARVELGGSAAPTSTSTTETCRSRRR